MSALLSQYLVMQQNVWGVRKVFTARVRATGQVVYLMEEPVQRVAGVPAPPRMRVVANTGATYWLSGTIPDGDSLEDLYRDGNLAESDVKAALLGVLGDLQSLLTLSPPMVPGYLDPACIKRTTDGQWVLDYLALAHAPEARVTGGLPLGVHPFGVLLYWLATGEKVRRSRIHVEQLGRNVPSAFQHFLVACLNRNLPSLAEVRTELERTVAEGHLRALIRHAGKRVEQQRAARLEAAPGNDPWKAWEQPTVLPAPPAGGRPEPQPPRSAGIAAAGVVPGARAAPVLAPQPAAAPLQYRRVALAGTYIPADDRPWAAPPRPEGGYRRHSPPIARPATQDRTLRMIRVALAIAGFSMLLMGAAIQLGWVPMEYMPLISAEKYLPYEQEHSAAASNGKLAPPEPGSDPDQVPEAGTVADLDLKAGGNRVQVYLNDQPVGIAYAFPHSRFPFLSLDAINELFQSTLYWKPQDPVTVRVYVGERSFLTDDYQLVGERLWLRLTPELQDQLGLRLKAATWEAFHFQIGH